MVYNYDICLPVFWFSYNLDLAGVLLHKVHQANKFSVVKPFNVGNLIRFQVVSFFFFQWRVLFIVGMTSLLGCFIFQCKCKGVYFSIIHFGIGQNKLKHDPCMINWTVWPGVPVNCFIFNRETMNKEHLVETYT